jgi:hypothetical protein
MKNRSLWAAPATESGSALRRCAPWSDLATLQHGESFPGRESPRAVMALVSVSVPYSWLMKLSFAPENSLGRTMGGTQLADRADCSGAPENALPPCRCHQTGGESLQQETLHASDAQRLEKLRDDCRGQAKCRGDSLGQEKFHGESEMASRGVPRGGVELQAGAGDGAVLHSVAPAQAGLRPPVLLVAAAVRQNRQVRSQCERPARLSLAWHAPRLGKALQTGPPASPASAVPLERLPVQQLWLQVGGALVPAETPPTVPAPGRVRGASWSAAAPAVISALWDL